MDLQKAKIYLEKLNREFGRMANDPENIMRIDVDIMASYIRDLYDAVLSEERITAHKAEAEPVRKTRHHDPAPTAVAPPSVAAAPPPPVVTAAPPPTPVQEVAPAPASPPPVQVIAPVPAPPVVVEQKPPAVVSAPPKKEEPVPVSGVIEALFEEKEAKELSEKLSELPIADLKKAIALNDRLLLTSELFAGDGKAFEATIGMVNALSSYDDAQAYLIEHCVVRYHWTDKKRIEPAKNFIKLVRRRFK